MSKIVPRNVDAIADDRDPEEECFIIRYEQLDLGRVRRAKGDILWSARDVTGLNRADGFPSVNAAARYLVDAFNATQ